jgi:hypothetical protein
MCRLLREDKHLTEHDANNCDENRQLTHGEILVCLIGRRLD